MESFFPPKPIFLCAVFHETYFFRLLSYLPCPPHTPALNPTPIPFSFPKRKNSNYKSYSRAQILPHLLLGGAAMHKRVSIWVCFFSPFVLRCWSDELSHVLVIYYLKMIKWFSRNTKEEKKKAVEITIVWYFVSFSCSLFHPLKKKS